MLEKTLDSPFDFKEIQLVHSKGDQSWVFIGRTDAEAETPVLWLPHEKSWLIGKDPDAGRDWGQEEKGTTEDRMAGWHHRLDGLEFEWTPGVGDGQGGLACFMGSQRVERDWATELNWSTFSRLRPVFLVRLVVHCIFVHWHLVVQFSLCRSFLIPGYKTSPRQLQSSSYFLHGKHSPWPAIGDSSYFAIVAAVAVSNSNQMLVFRFLRSKSDKTSPASLSWTRSLFGILLLYAINKTFLNSVNLKICTLL